MKVKFYLVALIFLALNLDLLAQEKTINVEITDPTSRGLLTGTIGVIGTVEDGYFLDECKNCGYSETNLATDKVCLNIDFIDGDRRNYKYENLRLLCPNCYFSFNGLFPKSKMFCK